MLDFLSLKKKNTTTTNNIYKNKYKNQTYVYNKYKITL